jgi:hypothetical protein
MRELRRMSIEVAAEFTKELRDVEALSREVKETTDAIKQAADVKSTLAESVEPALPSKALRRGSEQRTAGESREEPRESDVQGTTAQVEAEEGAPSEIKKPAKENETEDHE